LHLSAVAPAEPGVRKHRCKLCPGAFFENRQKPNSMTYGKEIKYWFIRRKLDTHPQIIKMRLNSTLLIQ